MLIALTLLCALAHSNAQTRLTGGNVESDPAKRMAAPDKFSIHVQGKGGHGAMPHETVDAMLVASMVCVLLFRPTCIAFAVG